MTLLLWIGQAFAVFVIAYVFMRIMGKRAVAQMSAFDLIVVILLGSMLASTLANQKTVTQTIITSVFVVLAYLIASYLMLNNNVRQAIRAKPTVLVNKGNIDEAGLRQARMTVPELLGHLRIKGYSSIADVEFAIMEEAGQLSVIPKSQKAPVTPSVLSIVTAPASLPVPIIIDGEWIDDNLSYLQLNRETALQQLGMHAIRPEDIKNLTLVQVEPNGSMTIDANEPAIQGQFPPGQYMSAQQATTGIMPGNASTPPISEITKNALAVIQERGKTDNKETVGKTTFSQAPLKQTINDHEIAIQKVNTEKETIKNKKES